MSRPRTRTEPIGRQVLAAAVPLVPDVADTLTAPFILDPEHAGEIDDFLQATETIARRFFGAGLDFEASIKTATGLAFEDERLQHLNNLHIDECAAQVRAGFALGLAWGQRAPTA